MAAVKRSSCGDPRQHAKVLYPLPEILLLVLSPTIAGADDFVETTLWGTEHLAFLRRFYRCESSCSPIRRTMWRSKRMRPWTGGRIETRRHTVCQKVGWITSDGHYPGEPVFPRHDRSR